MKDSERLYDSFIFPEDSFHCSTVILLWVTLFLFLSCHSTGILLLRLLDIRNHQAKYRLETDSLFHPSFIRPQAANETRKSLPLSFSRDIAVAEESAHWSLLSTHPTPPHSPLSHLLAVQLTTSEDELFFMCFYWRSPPLEDASHSSFSIAVNTLEGASLLLLPYDGLWIFGTTLFISLSAHNITITIITAQRKKEKHILCNCQAESCAKVDKP